MRAGVDNGAASAACGVVAVVLGSAAATVWVAAASPGSRFPAWPAWVLSILTVSAIYLCFAFVFGIWPTGGDGKRRDGRGSHAVQITPSATATSHDQPSATATAATRAPHATSASHVLGTTPTSSANGIPAPNSAGRRVTRKMAESYKAMSADSERHIRDRMEAAEKASLLSREVGAQAYRAIASDTRPDEYGGRRLTVSDRKEAARKAGLLSAEVGAEAYKAIASDTSLSSLSRKEAAERACDLSPEIGAAALRAIAKNRQRRRIIARAALEVAYTPLAVIFLFTNICVPAAVGWLFAGHFIHLLGDHLRTINVASFPISLCIAVFAGATGGAMLWKFHRRNPPYPSLVFEQGYGFSLLVSLCVFTAFAVVSGVLHAGAPNEAGHLLRIEHYSQLVCDWLSLKFLGYICPYSVGYRQRQRPIAVMQLLCDKGASHSNV
jgi:hypothetical protein